LSVLLVGLLLLVVAADAWGFPHWEHASKLEFAELALIALDVLVADQTGPALLHGQRVAFLPSCVLVKSLRHCLRLP
jgi:hypothetical protein